MLHLFIINPAAGRYNHADEIRTAVSELMRRHDRDGIAHSFAMIETQYPGHASEIVSEFALKGMPLRVYACGGDGTLHEVVMGAAGLPHVSVTGYPCGTGNDFVRTFGMERFQNLERLISGEARLLDLIDCGGNSHSINICSVGLDARVVDAAQAVTKKIPFISGKATYYSAVLKAMTTGIHKHYHVTVDGESYDGRYTLLAAANGRFYGGGFNPAPDALQDDGMLDFLLVKAVSPFAVAKLIRTYEKGGYAGIPDVIKFIRGKRMDIVCEDGDIANCDGEVTKMRECTFRVSEKKISFIVPE